MKSINLDAKVVETIAGNHEETLRLLEERFAVTITARGTDVLVTAREAESEGGVDNVVSFLDQIQGLQAEGVELRRGDLRTAVELLAGDPLTRLRDHFVTYRIRTSTKRTIVPKSENQRRYISEMQKNDLVFGIGPAGTGKTYLAVAKAVSMLNDRRVKRIVLARPAVEAGENLGFLPGDLLAKVDPYLRPLYDALDDMLEPARAERFLEDGTIEVAPLAFMRGRTLDHAFMILDEAQNTTSEQMKMFLTRIGVNSKAVVTGDVTQIDLPSSKVSGLVEAREIIRGVKGISFVEFAEVDVVRHPLVKRIIRAYADRDTNRKS